MPDTESSCEHLCPECGTSENAEFIVPMNFTNMWRLVPKLIWVVLLCSLAIYTTPWIQSIRSNPLAFQSHSTNGDDGHVHVLTPSLSAYTLTDNPEQVIGILELGFDQLEKSNPDWWKDSDYRFFFHSGHGTAADGRVSGFGSPWWSIRAQTVLKDLNTIRTESDSFDYSIETVSGGQFGFLTKTDTPAFTRQTARLHGAQIENKFISLVGISEAILVTCAGCHLAIMLLSKFFRRPSTLWVSLFYFLAIASVILLGTTNTENTQLITSHLRPGVVVSDATRWYSDEEFLNFTQSQDAREQLIDDLSEFARWANPNAVLGFQPRHKHGTELQDHTASYSEHHPIWAYRYTKFTQELDDGTTVPAPKCERVPGGLDIRFDSMFYQIIFAYTRDNDMFSVRLHWMRTLSISIIFWAIYVLLHRASSGTLRSFQQSRVRKDLCITCGYPRKSKELP